MNLLKSTGVIAGMTLISRIFGFVRDILLARVLGASAAADAWQLAFQLPNIFRRLFAEGAFSAAFVPLFNRHAHKRDGEEGDGKAQSERFASEILAMFVPVLIGFTALFELAMPWVIWFIDDMGQGGRTNDFSITLSRITFFYLGLISLTTLAAAILNILSRFAAAAFAPVLLNLCLITALLLGSNLHDGAEQTVRTAYYLAYATAVAGLLQMLWLFFWVRRAGFRLHFKRPKLTRDVRELGVLILPAVFGAGFYQIRRFVDLFFLGRLPEGSFVYLAMADRLNQLPLGLIGIALSTAILPALSRFIAQDDKGGAQRIQSNAIELGLLLTIPAAVALFVAAGPLTTAFYQGGQFSAEDAGVTAGVVMALVAGLPAYVLVKVLTPGFFARKDTKTPVYTAGIALAINIGANLILIPIFGIFGLAASGALSAWSNCVMLYVMLHAKEHYRLEPDLVWRLGRILLSAAGMAALLLWLIPMGGDYYGGGVLARVLSILALCLAGGFVYLALAWVTGAIDKKKIAMLTKKEAATDAATEG